MVLVRLPRLSEWHVVGSVRGKRGRRVVVMEIGGLSAQAVGSMRVAVWFNGMRVSSRKVAASHAVEVPRMDSVSRWVGRPPFCCWWAEVRSRERGRGQIVSRDSGVASVRASGPLCPWGAGGVSPRLQDGLHDSNSKPSQPQRKFQVQHKNNVAVGHVIYVLP